MWCEIHQHSSRGSSCNRCNRRDTAKKSYNPSNPHARGHGGIRLPDYSNLPKLEDLPKSRQDWTPEDWDVFRIRMAESSLLDKRAFEE